MAFVNQSLRSNLQVRKDIVLGWTVAATLLGVVGAPGDVGVPGVTGIHDRFATKHSLVDQKKKRREQTGSRLSSASVWDYADCLYEIGIVNTPLTAGLNFH